MSSPSATLTVWAASWLAGDSSPDDVIDALAQWAPMHLLGASDEETAARLDLEWPGVAESGVSLLLRILRSHPTGIRLVLPAAGDVRGLPNGTTFASATIAAGEGVQVGALGLPGIGLVPVVEGPDVLRWTAYSIPEVTGQADHRGLREVEYDLRQAVREAAETLSGSLTVATGTPGLQARTMIAERRQKQAEHRWPASLSPRQIQVIDLADNVAAILEVAATAATELAPAAAGEYARESLLRRLWDTVRAARVAAANSVSVTA